MSSLVCGCIIAMIIEMITIMTYALRDLMRGLKWRIKAIVEIIKFHTAFVAKSALACRNRKSTYVPKVCFIVGCGRSGTTLLGKLISLHPDVQYYNEPRHLWLAISRAADIWGYVAYPDAERSLIIEEGNEIQKSRFDRLFLKSVDKGKYVVEKSPENVFRLSWLDTLTKDAKILQIHRNGNDVIRSINTESNFDIPYGFCDMNNWYGKRNMKMNCLLAAAKSLNVDESILSSCRSKTDFAALEWICSLRSFRKYKQFEKNERILEIRYEDLLEYPWPVMEKIYNYLGLRSNDNLVNVVQDYVKKPKCKASALLISPHLQVEFDKEMSRLGYI